MAYLIPLQSAMKCVSCDLAWQLRALPSHVAHSIAENKRSQILEKGAPRTGIKN
jgi:hypothetical protein